MQKLHWTPVDYSDVPNGWLVANELDTQIRIHPTNENLENRWRWLHEQKIFQNAFSKMLRQFVKQTSSL